jgi:hypothetical protein
MCELANMLNAEGSRSRRVDDRPGLISRHSAYLDRAPVAPQPCMATDGMGTACGMLAVAQVAAPPHARLAA